MENKDNLNFEEIKDSNEKIAIYRKKFIISRLIYILIAITIMVISSLQILLNLFAIRWNSEPTLKLLFLIIAIISTIVVFLQSVLLFFDFKNSREKNLAKLRSIQQLKENYLKNPEEFNISQMANAIYDIDKEN
ncbi:DUF4231 domain-containing protein [Mycoplasma zalophi]|uniref:DUF4231 domain-containing protein n=1 Tax=Mycoplasma zalophi TaxID=191287 RepID=A0ABS6DRQ4_9MOLU|nr:DUF4231 domain-containing protein [Mycoplasma zalophi]MBU4691279.1 DUF4231 domain-containing protein [Mycoplasma zalophi]MBU4692515.1 DUF4231 domain-containing protein [Mycoplasma zalophi]